MVVSLVARHRDVELHGQAFNIACAETHTLPQFIAAMASCLGAHTLVCVWHAHLQHAHCVADGHAVPAIVQGLLPLRAAR